MVPLRNLPLCICLLFSILSICDGKRDELLETLKNDFDTVMENETALRAMSVVLNTVKDVVENEVGSQVIIGIMEQITGTLKHARGSQSVHVILEGIKTALTNKASTDMLTQLSNDLKEVAVLPQATAVVKMGTDLMTMFMKYNLSADLIDAYADGLVSVIQLPEPKEKITRVFRNLRNIVFFQWIGSNNGAVPADD